jgi:hypothetical protein
VAAAVTIGVDVVSIEFSHFAEEGTYEKDNTCLVVDGNCSWPRLSQMMDMPMMEHRAGHGMMGMCLKHAEMMKP